MVIIPYPNRMQFQAQGRKTVIADEKKDRDASDPNQEPRIHIIVSYHLIGSNGSNCLAKPEWRKLHASLVCICWSLYKEHRVKAVSKVAS